MPSLRESPRFSANKLAEYVVATPRRRRRLILEQIGPVRYRTNRYEHARRILRQWVCSPGASVDSLSVSAALLRDKAAPLDPKSLEANWLLDSARAVEAFRSIATEFRFRNLVAVPGGRRAKPLRLRGVAVSVFPDVYLAEIGTEHHVGALKFHMSRTHRLTSEALQNVSLLLLRYGEQGASAVRRSQCLSVDVFSGACESAPRAVKTRTRDIEAGCEEIAARWPGLLLVARAKLRRSAGLS